MKPRRALVAAAVSGMIGLACAQADAATDAAQAYPTRPVHIIVPFAAGGGVDTVARIIAEPLSVRLRQSVIVDNKPGASANLGAAYVAKSEPDGHTLLLASSGLSVNVTLFAHPGFTLRDFAPVERIGYAPLVFVVPTASPAHSFKELTALARAQPGKLTYGSAGNGSSSHLAGELLKTMAGIDVVHVPYKGGAPAVTDLLAGRIAFMATNPIEVLSYIRAGRLRALAVGGPERFGLLPAVPTVSEQGLPGYEATVWWGIVVPAHTPPAIVATLSKDAAAVLADPATRQKLTDVGVVVTPDGPAGFGNFLKTEVAKWARVIKTSNVHVE